MWNTGIESWRFADIEFPDRRTSEDTMRTDIKSCITYLNLKLRHVATTGRLPGKQLHNVFALKSRTSLVFVLTLDFVMLSLIGLNGWYPLFH